MMRQLFKIEFYKLWKKKNIYHFSFLDFIDKRFSTSIYANLNTNTSPVAYQKLQSQLEKNPNEQRFSLKNITTNRSLWHLTTAFLFISRSEENKDMIESIRSQYPDVEEDYSKLYYANEVDYYTTNLESEAVLLKRYMLECVY